MKLTQLTVSLLLVLSAVSCTDHQDRQLPNAKKDSDTAGSTVTPTPSTPPVVCPEHDDVRALIADSKTLIDDALLIVSNANKVHSANRPETFKAQITSWKHREQDWEAKNKELIANCDQLLGADGTAVYPEIPLALEKLSQAGKWLGRSMDALELGKVKTAETFMKRARFATARATKVLDGRRGRKQSATIPQL